MHAHCVEQSCAGCSQQSSDDLIGLQQACFPNQSPTDYRPCSEEGDVWNGIDATLDSGLPMDGLEVDWKIELRIKVSEVGA